MQKMGMEVKCGAFAPSVTELKKMWYVKIAQTHALTAQIFPSNCRTEGIRFCMWIECVTNAATALCFVPMTPPPYHDKFTLFHDRESFDVTPEN